MGLELRLSNHSISNRQGV